MSNGSIQVRVYTSRAQIPLENATVLVTIEDNNLEFLSGVRMTDREGKIEKIIVETPALQNSTEPFQDRGFVICNIRIQHENYYDVIVRDAQVFPDTITIQDVEMIPLKENSPEGERLRTIIVPAQNL